MVYCANIRPRHFQTLGTRSITSALDLVFFSFELRTWIIVCPIRSLFFSSFLADMTVEFVHQVTAELKSLLPKITDQSVLTVINGVEK